MTQRLSKSRDIEYWKSKWRHQQKLENLDTGKKWTNEPDLTGETLKKWVINLSQYKPSPSVLNILSKGANFAILPVEITIKGYIAQMELACFGLSEDKANGLQAEIRGAISSAKSPTSNISKEENTPSSPSKG